LKIRKILAYILIPAAIIASFLIVLIIIAQVSETERNVLTITFVLTVLEDIIVSPSM